MGYWTPDSNNMVSNTTDGSISCVTFIDVCPDRDEKCFKDTNKINGANVVFDDLDNFRKECISGCDELSWVHGSLMFNTFVFAQVFNEYNSKSIHSDVDVFSSILENKIFLFVTCVTVALQVMLIEVGGAFFENITSVHATVVNYHWSWCPGSP